MGTIWSTFWPDPPLQNKPSLQNKPTISRQSLQHSTLKEITQMEQCPHCYQDTRLGFLLRQYIRQDFPWDNPPHCYSPFHLRFRRNYQPKECYHCPKGRFQEHESCKILDRLFNKATNTCQCTAPVPDIDLQQLTEDEEESDISDINENS